MAEYIVEIRVCITASQDEAKTLESTTEDVKEWLYTELANEGFEPTDVTYKIKEKTCDKI